MEAERGYKMKAAFDIFFIKMNESWKREWNTYPRITFSEKKEKCGLFISDMDEEGYAEWQPKLQTEKVDFDKIEETLGFEIHNDIKKYLSTYWFFPLDSACEGVEQLQLREILPNCDMKKEILDRFKKERFHYKEEGEYFLIGDFCCIEGDDSYSLQVNNTTGEVMAVQALDEEEIKIANSIEDLLLNMKGEWD